MRSHNLSRTENVNISRFYTPPVSSSFTLFPSLSLTIVSFGNPVIKGKQSDGKKNEIHYDSFSIDGHEYKIGDHVKLDPSDDDDDDTDDSNKEFWYALIADIYYKKNDETPAENCKTINHKHHNPFPNKPSHLPFFKRVQHKRCMVFQAQRRRIRRQSYSQV